MSTTVATLRRNAAGACMLMSAIGIGGAASERPISAAPSGVAMATPRRSPPTSAQAVFEAQLDSLTAATDTLAHWVSIGQPREVRRAFRRARTAYKEAEGLIAYHAPAAIIALQGPLEAEGEDQVQPRPYNTPGAFPAIESAIFPRILDSARPSILARVRAIRERIAVLRSVTGTLAFDDDAVFEAARIEIARVSTLDIAGFDSDREDDALVDAAAALDGVRATVRIPAEGESEPVTTSRRRVDSTLREAAGYLRRHPAFETMDRLTFLTHYSLPASHALAALRSARSIPPAPGTRLWRTAVASVYDSGAFDVMAFATRHAYTPITGERLVALGQRLFTDPRLSGPGTRACAGCHIPGRAFTDGAPKRAPLVAGVPRPPGAPPARHTPTLLNAALQPTLFADGRARGLEQQLTMVLNDPDEMHSSIDTAVSRVAADSSYRAAFAAAFGRPTDRVVTPAALRIALASYVRSLTVLNSPFDRAVRGDSMALSAEARRGFTVFMGKGRCGTCHFAPLFNGTQPPSYLTTDPEIIGVPERPALDRARLDPDPGRAGIDQVETHRYAFKVPTVRNAALTAPYMHNGAFPSLDDVVAFYNAGGGVGIGIDLPYQTLFDHPLELTRGERSDLVAFLRALTDTSGTVPPPSPVALR